MSETELLQAFRNERSEAAFAELVRRYAGLVYSVAKRRLANTALAEDVTQIVFIRFAKAPPPVRDHGQLVAWLHRTATHVTIDTWRAETRRRAREEQALVMEPSTPHLWEDLAPELDAALNQLEDPDRQVLLLRFFGDKSMREVGAALGVSEDAAKMRVSRAVDRLRTRLGARAAACTAAGLGGLLAEHAVEAAPEQLVARLAALRLPALGGGSAVGQALALLRRSAGMQFAAAAVVLVLVGVGVVSLRSSRQAPVLGTKTKTTSPAPTQAVGLTRLKRPGVPVPTAGAPPAKAARFWLHVLDAETGEGLGHASIHYTYFGAGGEGEGHDVLADDYGDAPIAEPNDPTKGGPNVFVAVEGHVPKVVGLGAEVPEDYTMRLDPALTAAGKVVDEQGQPVAEVKLRLQTPGNKKGQRENVDFQTCPVTTREDGTWSYSYVPRDYTNEMWFVLQKAGYATSVPVVEVAQADLTNLVLVINRGFTVTGQVTDAQGQPVTNAEVRVLAGDPSRRRSAKTDAQGLYTLVGVVGQSPTTEHSTAHQAVEQSIEQVRALVQQTTELDRLQRLSPAQLAHATLSSTVQDPELSALLAQLAQQEQQLAARQPAPDPREAEAQKASVLATALKQKLADRLQAVRLAVENGVASSRQLASAEEEARKQASLQAQLAVQAKGFAPQLTNLALVSVTNTAPFALGPGRHFRGHVVDEAGQPIANAVVRTDWDFQNQIPTQFEWTAHTDAEGRFDWDSAPEQAICYWFDAHGHQWLRGVPFLADGSDHEIVLRSGAAKQAAARPTAPRAAGP